MTRALFLVGEVFNVPGMRKIAVTGHVQQGEIRTGDILTIRGSGSRIRVEGLNFPGAAAADQDRISLLIPPDTAPVPQRGDYLEGDDR